MTAAPLEVAHQPVVGEQPAWLPTRLPDQYRGDLTKALRKLRERRPVIDTLWQYHNGDHPQVWYSEALRKAFDGKGLADLQDNYCGLVVWAPLSRLAVKGWESRVAAPVAPRTVGSAPNEAATPAEVAAAAARWEAASLDLAQEGVYRATIVAGQHMVQVWPRIDPLTGEQATDDEGRPAFDVVPKDARSCYVEPGAAPRSRKWAAVVWITPRCWRATIYYAAADGMPAEVVRLRTPEAKQTTRDFPQQAGRFYLDPDDPGGPMPDVFAGQCPVVSFALDDDGRSWLFDAVPLQDKINKLSGNKMVAAEFLAFPQRYILTDQEVRDGALRYSPASVLQLDPGGDTDETTGQKKAPTAVGEFSTVDLENYDKAIQSEVDKLFTIKLLPRHLQVNPGAAPSGEATKADEGPHTTLVRSWARKLGASWTDVQQLMGNDVRPVWESPETRNALAEAEELERLVRAQVPLLQALRKVGWTAEEIEAVGGELEALRVTRENAERAAAVAAQQARPAADLGNTDDGMSMESRVKMANELVRTGWEPVSVAMALDLPAELIHTGRLPTSVEAEPSDAPDPQAEDAPPPGVTPPQLADTALPPTPPTGD